MICFYVCFVFFFYPLSSFARMTKHIRSSHYSTDRISGNFKCPQSIVGTDDSFFSRHSLHKIIEELKSGRASVRGKVLHKCQYMRFHCRLCDFACDLCDEWWPSDRHTPDASANVHCWSNTILFLLYSRVFIDCWEYAHSRTRIALLFDASTEWTNVSIIGTHLQFRWVYSAAPSRASETFLIYIYINKPTTCGEMSYRTFSVWMCTFTDDIWLLFADVLAGKCGQLDRVTIERLRAIQIIMWNDGLRVLSWLYIFRGIRLNVAKCYNAKCYRIDGLFFGYSWKSRCNTMWICGRSSWLLVTAFVQSSPSMSKINSFLLNM